MASAALGAAVIAPPANAQERAPSVTPEDMHWAAPALADHTDDVLFGEVWLRTDPSLRDRSLVTLSALIAGGNTAQLTGRSTTGIKPSEISALITHLAGAVSAVA